MSKQKIEIPNKKIHANLVDQRDRNKLFVENWFPTRIWFVDLPNAESINSKLMSDIDRWYERDTKGIIPIVSITTPLSNLYNLQL